MPTTPSRAVNASGGQLRGALPVVGGERRSCRRRSFRELRHVAQPLAVGPELLLALDRDLRGVLHERPQLGEPLCGRRRPAHELVVRAPRGLKLPPGDRSRARRRSCSSPQ